MKTKTGKVDAELELEFLSGAPRSSPVFTRTSSAHIKRSFNPSNALDTELSKLMSKKATTKGSRVILESTFTSEESTEKDSLESAFEQVFDEMDSSDFVIEEFEPLDDEIEDVSENRGKQKSDHGCEKKHKKKDKLADKENREDDQEKRKKKNKKKEDQDKKKKNKAKG